jgi:hypothetical protein
VTVRLSGTLTLNRCDRDVAYPLTCRVLLVNDTSPIKGLELKQVWGKERSVFQSSLLADPHELAVAPGQSDVILPVTCPSGATAVIVEGNFYCARPTGWYVERPISKGRKLRLLAGTDSLVIDP